MEEEVEKIMQKRKVNKKVCSIYLEQFVQFVFEVAILMF